MRVQIISHIKSRVQKPLRHRVLCGAKRNVTTISRLINRREVATRFNNLKMMLMMMMMQMIFCMYRFCYIRISCRRLSALAVVFLPSISYRAAVRLSSTIMFRVYISNILLQIWSVCRRKKKLVIPIRKTTTIKRQKKVLIIYERLHLTLAVLHQVEQEQKLYLVVKIV